MVFWKDRLSRHGDEKIAADDLPYRVGQGNWLALEQSNLRFESIVEKALSWSRQFAGIEKPWLCWNVDSDWCLAQQQLVEHCGWTPVIGFDPRTGPPKKTIPGAVVIDFNEGLNLPVLYPHFVMEFVFLFANRLAFWHSDLLVREPLLRSIVKRFDHIQDGETIATKYHHGRKAALVGDYQRHWELIGCTTRAASRSQFENGAGWWMSFAFHRSCRDMAERQRRMAHYWDHGAGIRYWHKKCGGRVHLVDDVGIHEGHCTKVGNPNYRRSVPINTSDAARSMTSELSAHFDLHEVCSKLGISSICLQGSHG